MDGYCIINTALRHTPLVVTFGWEAALLGPAGNPTVPDPLLLITYPGRFPMGQPPPSQGLILSGIAEASGSMLHPVTLT